MANEDDTPCCCGFEYTIEICNINSVTDDDWRVELNGKDIGTHHAPGMILAGTVWRTKDQIEVGCGQVTYKNLSKADFVNGQNNLYMTITALYNYANYGTVTVRSWKWDAAQNAFVENSVLLSSTYTGPSQIGYTNSFDFVYP